MNLDVTKEKLEFLLRTNLPKNNTLVSFDIDGSIDSKGGESLLVDYFLHIEIDNFEDSDSFADDYCGILRRLTEFINEFNEQYKIGYKGKINQDTNVWSGYYPKIMSCNFVWGEKNLISFTTGAYNG